MEASQSSVFHFTLEQSEQKRNDSIKCSWLHAGQKLTHSPWCIQLSWKYLNVTGKQIEVQTKNLCSLWIGLQTLMGLEELRPSRMGRAFSMGSRWEPFGSDPPGKAEESEHVARSATLFVHIKPSATIKPSLATLAPFLLTYHGNHSTRYRAVVERQSKKTQTRKRSLKN